MVGVEAVVALPCGPSLFLQSTTDSHDAKPARPTLVRRRAHEREHLRERGRLAVAYSTADLTNIHRAGRQHGRVLPRLPFLVLSEIDGRWIAEYECLGSVEFFLGERTTGMHARKLAQFRQ